MRQRLPLGGMAIVLTLFLAGPVHAQNASLSGYVTDATSGETLLLANVVLVGIQRGTATNNAGYYMLTGVPPGTYTVVCTYIGYQPFRQEIALAPGENRRLDIALLPESVEVDEVVVTADAEERETEKNIGVASVSTAAIKQLPTVLEPDVFRSLQLLPGVKSASDYSSGLYIRGGSPDQTLILLDRTTVYSPSHFFGFFSTFNPDAIKDVRLYKGGYPAEYGGRLGSVVDIYNKDGNRRATHGIASLGLLASRAMIEGPYSRGSYMLAVRRSTLEPLLAVLQDQDIDGIPNSFYFYDINGKVNFDATANDRLSLAVYAGRDALELEFLEDAEIDLTYGNRTLSADWQHIFSQALFSNFTVTASRYASTPAFTVAGSRFEQEIRIADYSVKGDLEYIPNERHTVKSGFWGGHFNFSFQQAFDDTVNFNPDLHSLYADLYVQETYRPSPQWMLRGGLRASYFASGNFLRLAPRVSVEYRPLANVRLQLGYGRYNQFLMLISSGGFSGFDFWLTTDRGVPPAYGDQFVAGIKTRLTRSINLDVETYYRTMRDLFERDPFLADAAGLPYEDIFQFGKGFAYGLEVQVEKTSGRLNGFLGYTLGRTERRFPQINAGAYYVPKYDRTHDVNLVLNYDLSRAWRFTSVFTYATGQAYTRPLGQYKLVGDPFQSEPRDLFDVPGRSFNNARLPAYHRLDVGFSRRGRFFGFADYELQLQLINVYGRRNIWFYNYDFKDDNTIDRTVVPQIPVPLPNIAFTLRV